MRRSRGFWALAAVLAINVVLVILLTPLGFESRPTSALMTVGYIAIGTIFAGLILFVVSIVLLFWKSRAAAILAIIGSVLYFFPIVGDRLGSFFSLPVPPAIKVLEYVLTVALLVTLFLASMMLKGAGRQ